MTERDEPYTPSVEALRREFEYRIRTAVTYGLGRGKTGDSAGRDVAGWIDREIGAAMASLTVSQVIEAVRAGAGPMTMPIQMPRVTRVEVIDSTGRAFVAYYEPGIEVHVQDDGRTLKIFASLRSSK